LKEAQEGKPIDRASLEEGIQKVYGKSEFERISYRFQPQQDAGDLLIVDAIEKAWGPGYLSFGLGLSSDFKGGYFFGICSTYVQSWVNQLGAEWTATATLGNVPSVFTEFYQPLNLDRLAFVAPYLSYDLNPESVFYEDQRVARYDVIRGRAGVDVGTTLRGVEVRAGGYYGMTDVSLDTGSPQLLEGYVTDSGVRGRLIYDTLDSAWAPRSGTKISLEALSPLTAFGADVEYTRALLTAQTAYSLGPNSVVGRLMAGSSFGKTMPYYDQFALGGFLRLSGYATDQFRGSDMAFGSLTYYRQIAELPPPIGRGLYLGGSFDVGWLSDGELRNSGTVGNVVLSPEATRYGGSLFFGSDTWIGPAYLGFGLSGDGDSAIYVLIGRP
jgi:NTE family protein